MSSTGKVMVGADGAYVRADLIQKIEVVRHGIDWRVICYLASPNESVQASVAFLTEPIPDERAATDRCDAMVRQLFDVVSDHRGGGARWPWHDPAVAAT
ncbi:MAG: hypothetical protein ACOYOQ_00035 [Microthrixaceae bacterium]